ncbi:MULTISPECIES: hypothetical protein [unclassified Brevibacterium]|uniref:hypothetical protein n=1 Tax=unclassified Brevibacterium TaxID=2614124 RepID=UPI0036404D09
MSKSVIGAIALVVLTLSACVAGDAEPNGQESPTQSAEAVPQAVQDKIAQWSRLSDVEIEPFNKDMGLFSGDQVELVSQDVIELAKSQLRADRASSSAEMEQQVKDLAAGAPGKLGESMTDQVELDRKDESEKFWTMPYVQPLDSSLDVVEDSRMSYAWDAKVEPVADGTGVTVTLFTRTAHWVNIDDGARTLIGISSWIALSTVDPEYAATSGDYAWQVYAHASNADICVAVKGKPFVPLPADETDKESLDFFTSFGKNEFVAIEKFKTPQEEIEKDIAKCE